MADPNLEKLSLGIPFKTWRPADCEFPSAYWGDSITNRPDALGIGASVSFALRSRYWSDFIPVFELEKRPDALDDFLSKEADGLKMLGVMQSLVDKTVKQWGSIPIRGFDQRTITSKLNLDCSDVLKMANRLIKKSQKLEIHPANHQPDVGSIIQEAGSDDHLTQVHPQDYDSVATAGNRTIFLDKHGPDVGSTTFSGLPSGGGQSSPDTCGDGLHTQGHDSAATAGTFELPSPAFNNKSSVTDQKPFQKCEIFLTTYGSKPHGEQSFQDSVDEDHIIQVDHQSHDSATFGSISASNSSSVVADQKPYKNVATSLDKYGPRVGSTAFRSQPSGGQQSSPGGGGEDHIIEGHYKGHDSAATAGSPELASPALNNTPSASDQSRRASALPENRDDDEQPPPDRSASDMERGVAPPAERQLNPSVAKICLVASSAVCIAPLQTWYSAGASISPNATILLLFVEAFGVAGILLCLGAYIFQRKRKISRVMTVMGCVATICGFLSILGTRFPEEAMLWLTAALCVLPIAASPFALKELV